MFAPLKSHFCSEREEKFLEPTYKLLSRWVGEFWNQGRSPARVQVEQKINIVLFDVWKINLFFKKEKKLNISIAAIKWFKVKKEKDWRQSIYTYKAESQWLINKFIHH